jgi:hypothetical protein
MTIILIISTVLFMTDFDFIPRDWLLKKIVALGMELRIVIWIREFLLGHTQRVGFIGQLSEEVKSNVKCAARECIGSTIFSSVCKSYLEEH